MKSIQMPSEKRINIISLDDLSTCTLPLTTNSASIILKENRNIWKQFYSIKGSRQIIMII